jgi:hypothetical protein
MPVLAILGGPTELDALLASKASALRRARNDVGLRYQRATYSKSFERVEDNTFAMMRMQETTS